MRIIDGLWMAVCTPLFGGATLCHPMASILATSKKKLLVTKGIATRSKGRY